MANFSQVRRLQASIEGWNTWRSKYPTVRINLSGVDLSETKLNGADLSEADLNGAKLSGVDLSEANLREADLRGFDLSGANLSGANLSGANLSGVNLSGVNLSKANLHGANLSGTNLKKADLRGFDLTSTNLGRTNLSGASLIDAELREANLREANLSGADLKEANLIGAELREANLREADLSGADLKEANLIEAELIKANLREANLRGAKLQGAKLRGAKLIRANLREAKLFATKLEDADLSGADLSGAHLFMARLTFTELGGAKLIRADLREAGLGAANLNGANLNGANLGGANLNGAKLRTANLIETNLHEADLSGADLSGADLSAARLVKAQVLATNFESAVLTGACLKNWNTNHLTNLEGVKADYVYLGDEGNSFHKESEWSNRRPHSGNFKPGEFAALFQQALNTLDLIFVDGIDWQAFFTSFQELRQQYNNAELNIQAIERKPGGDFVIRLDVAADADKAAIEKSAKTHYQTQLQLVEACYKAQLQAKDTEIESYKRESSNMLEITKLLASKTITVNQPTTNFNAPVSGIVGSTFNDNAQVQGNTFNQTNEASQNLAEAAAEIQTLLDQLSATYPTETLTEKAQLVEVAIAQVHTNLPLKQRILSALDAGTLGAIAQALNHPAAAFFIEAIKDWNNSSGNPKP